MNSKDSLSSSKINSRSLPVYMCNRVIIVHKQRIHNTKHQTYTTESQRGWYHLPTVSKSHFVGRNRWPLVPNGQRY